MAILLYIPSEAGPNRDRMQLPTPSIHILYNKPLFATNNPPIPLTHRGFVRSFTRSFVRPSDSHFYPRGGIRTSYRVSKTTLADVRDECPSFPYFTRKPDGETDGRIERAVRRLTRLFNPRGPTRFRVSGSRLHIPQPHRATNTGGTSERVAFETESSNEISSNRKLFLVFFFWLKSFSQTDITVSFGCGWRKGYMYKCHNVA